MFINFLVRTLNCTYVKNAYENIKKNFSWKEDTRVKLKKFFLTAQMAQNSKSFNEFGSMYIHPTYIGSYRRL